MMRDDMTDVDEKDETVDAWHFVGATLRAWLEMRRHARLAAAYRARRMP